MTKPSSIQCFNPRPVRAMRVVNSDGWTLKPYRVHGRESPHPDFLSAPAISSIAAILPQPAVASNRPGIAIVIEHLASPLDYLVLCWWDNRNELFTRIFVRSGAQPWRQSSTESFCVWDLDIMWFERNAFVKHMLAGVPDPAAYAAARFDKAFAG